MTTAVPGTFSIEATCGQARRGRFSTAHGSFETPAFMPVGTQATVKGLAPEDLKLAGAQIILSNTYHLHLRPGDELIRELGGLHTFMGWNGPILTDSGGFQVYSLAQLRKISAEGVVFQSHIDGKLVSLTPERVVQIQDNLGVDIMMILDDCVPYPADKPRTEEGLLRSLEWAKRARVVKPEHGRSLMFGIVQGGMFPDLRQRAVEELAALNFDGYSIGGLSVGEPVSLMDEMVAHTAPLMPAHTVRYLMGVGMPRDIVTSVAQGVDIFDCVIPTRSARFGRLFAGTSWINIRNTRFRKDSGPIDESCTCYTCQSFSRAYLSHLLHSSEILYHRLASLHNVHYFQSLMRSIRTAISEQRLDDLVRSFQIAPAADTTGES